MDRVMPPDPVSPVAGRVALWRCSDGHVHNWFTVVGDRKFCVQPDCINPDDPVQFIRASVVDDLRARLEGVEAENERLRRNEETFGGLDQTNAELGEALILARADLGAAEARAERAEEALRMADTLLTTADGEHTAQGFAAALGAHSTIRYALNALSSHPEEPKA